MSIVVVQTRQMMDFLRIRLPGNSKDRVKRFSFLYMTSQLSFIDARDCGGYDADVMRMWDADGFSGVCCILCKASMDDSTIV